LLRILAHLNICGFRKYAIELVKFIETQVYGKGKENYYFNHFIKGKK